MKTVKKSLPGKGVKGMGKNKVVQEPSAPAARYCARCGCNRVNIGCCNVCGGRLT